ncbi:hypothetical protein [Streptomyces sp. NPDC046821]|uniref:hypothetical protein n=1 Tax=Streptomyces sp. NPDC046821 TaxID=3154702 RepID=UPI0033C38020
MERPSPFAEFGALAAKLLDQWQQQNHRPLSAPKWLDTGGSGALLASVFVRDGDPRRPNRRMIIKLCSPDRGASMEPGRHTAAIRSLPNGSGAYPRHHLVEQLYDPMPVGDAWLMFQGFAGNDETMVTLSTILRQLRLPGVAAEITRSLLADWNPDERTNGEMTAAEFVAELLDRRLERDGPLSVWVREELGLDLSTPWIRTGRPGALPVPNPVHLQESCALAEHTVAYPMRGRAHGDLHPGNIMVPKEPDADISRYVLIDLSRFDDGALLARDPAHLLLCLVADFLPHLSDDARAELLELLVGRDTPGLLIPQGLAQVIHKVRAAPDDWLRRRTVSSEWPGQWLLSLQACALMFTARARYDARDRWWFFRLAAEAAGEYLRSVDAYEPGESVFVAGPRGAAGPTAEGKLPAQRTPVPVRPADVAPYVAATVRVPDPTPVSDEASSSATEEAASPGPGDVAGPPPVDSPEVGDAVALSSLLVELRDTFGGFLEEIRRQKSSSVTAGSLGPVEHAATEGYINLTFLLPATPSPLSEGSRRLLDAMLEQLDHVSKAAKDPKFGEEQASFLRDLAHRALVVAMGQLLATVNEALQRGEFR